MQQTIFTSVYEIAPLLKEKNVFLVEDGAYDYLNVKGFFEKFSCIEFCDFTPNPLYEQVCNGVDLFRKRKGEIIVAVGGGSTIDVAKCIKLFCNMNPKENYLSQKVIPSNVPFVAVPTTAGTGSESTRHAVIYYNGVKQSISDESILPDYAVLDSSVLKTLPLYQKKCTLLDALCQAIESWWSVHSTKESIEYSRKAIKLICDNWKSYLYDNDEDAAKKIMYGANYAGKAINITATTAAHAMSYKITSLYNLPHGHAVAICMPEVWRYMVEHAEESNDNRGKDFLQKELLKISELCSLNYFIEMIRQMEISGPASNSPIEDVERLVESVNPERLKNYPINLSTDVIRKMYKRILQI